MTSLTRLIATALEAALAQLVLTARSLLVLVLPAWRRRSRMMSNPLPRHQRTLELDRLPLDFTPDILELAPYPQIFVPEQLVTARRDPSVVDTRRGSTWRKLRSAAPGSGPDGHSVPWAEKRHSDILAGGGAERATENLFYCLIIVMQTMTLRGRERRR